MLDVPLYPFLSRCPLVPFPIPLFPIIPFPILLVPLYPCPLIPLSPYTLIPLYPYTLVPFVKPVSVNPPVVAVPTEYTLDLRCSLMSLFPYPDSCSRIPVDAYGPVWTLIDPYPDSCSRIPVCPHHRIPTTCYLIPLYVPHTLM